MILSEADEHRISDFLARKFKQFEIEDEDAASHTARQFDDLMTRVQST